MSVKRRVRWFLIHLRRGDIDAVSLERIAVYGMMMVLLVSFLVLVGAPVRRAWSEINQSLSTVSPGH